MSPIPETLPREAAEPRRNSTPRPSPSPSVAGIEHDKDLALRNESNTAKDPAFRNDDASLHASAEIDQSSKKRRDQKAEGLDKKPTQKESLIHPTLQAHDLDASTIISNADFPSREAAEPPRKLNPRSSPSSSMVGMEDELKDLALESESNITRYPPSLDTDSTLSFNTGINQDLMAQIHSIDWLLDITPIQMPGLTHLALQAHDLNTIESSYNRDLASWCRDDYFDRSDHHVGLADSILVTKSSKSLAASYKELVAASYTSSSYDMLSDIDPAADMDHDVCGTGAAFIDIPVPVLDEFLVLDDDPVMEDNPSSKLQAESVRLVEEDSNAQPITNWILNKDTNQQAVITQAGPSYPEHEYPDLREQYEDVGPPYHLWIAKIWYWLAAVLDPPQSGAYRATYTCGCGALCYIDIDDLVPGEAAKLEQDIRKEAGSVRCRNPSVHTSSHDNIQPPVPAHLATSTMSHTGEQGVPIQGLPSLEEHPEGSVMAENTTQEPAATIENTEKRYLLLCVNTKHGLVKLVHIDVSALTNDQFLFQEIRNEYKTARQGHDWNLAMLILDKNNFLQSTLAWISKVSPRNIKLPQWITNALQDCRIFVPRKIEFIKFELMPVRLTICAGNIEKPEIPGVEEVQVKKTYIYEPITIKAKIQSVPVHELLKPGPHFNRFWLRRFPKKLDTPLTFDEDLDCCGWGILITEGWNRPFVLFLSLLAMIIFVVFVTLYSVFTNDGSTGAGIGSFMMAILTLYCTLKYEQWKEQ